MNGDLISRSALLAAYDKAPQGPPGGARKLIEDAPEALVRCKDCKYAVLTIRGEAKYCEFWQGDEDGTYGGDPLYLDGDFYCAAGDRR
jgi:hypothetical protein